MRLMNARLCLDCEELHDQQHCPVCGSESFAFLTRWVTPSDTIAAESTPRSTRPPDLVDRREQVDVYKKLLNPPPPTRRGRVVAGGALGLALLGLARMVWRAAPDGKAAQEGKKDVSPKGDARARGMFDRG